MDYLGIEIGGTKLQLGVGAGDGVLKGLWRDTVDVAAGPVGIRRQISAAVPELLSRVGIARSSLGGVGIGFGGPVDDATRTVVKSHQIEGWDDFPLADWIGEVVGLPAVLGNDADVAGLAEALLGSGKGLSPVFYLTIGSGIGGGLVLEGELFRGCGRGAAEIGHLLITRHTDNGVVGVPMELLASGWALGRMARESLTSPAGRASALYREGGGKAEEVTGQRVGECAARGDAFCLGILDQAWSALAEAICHVITLLCPRRIVIGGGISQLGEALLFEPLRRKVAERVFRPFAGCYDIVPASLGEEVVVHGALVLARKKREPRQPTDEIRRS